MQADARLEIEYLRRRYAKATDLIGTGADEAVAEGRNIYHAIFTPDVFLTTAGTAGDPLVANGPEEWVDVVLGALGDYSATQHLIGTQIVDIKSLETDASGAVRSGEALLESYLQAWHEKLSDGTVWVFIGTYVDRVTFSAEGGWQIAESTLHQLSGETRLLGAL